MISGGGWGAARVAIGERARRKDIKLVENILCLLSALIVIAVVLLADDGPYF